MFLKTSVQNKTKATRNLRWAGIKGISIAPEATLEMDGGYPTACRNDACRKQFESEVSEGLIDVTLITDMDVKQVDSTPKQAPLPIVTPVAEIVKEKPTTPASTNVSDHLVVVESPDEVRKSIETPTFSEGPMDSFFKKAFGDKGTISLDDDQGKAPEERPENSAVPIFQDAKSPKLGKAVAGGDTAEVFEDTGNAKADGKLASDVFNDVTPKEEVKVKRTRKPRAKKKDTVNVD